MRGEGDQSVRFQPVECFANGGSTDPELLSQLALDESLARPDGSAEDQRSESINDRLRRGDLGRLAPVLRDGLHSSVVGESANHFAKRINDWL